MVCGDGGEIKKAQTGNGLRRWRRDKNNNTGNGGAVVFGRGSDFGGFGRGGRGSGISGIFRDFPGFSGIFRERFLERFWGFWGFPAGGGAYGAQTLDL